MTRLIPDWEVRITNFGLGYILMCLVVAIAATNTGNNNLYIVLAAMLAAMVVSGIISRRNVRGVFCEIEAIDEVTATRPALLRLRLENRMKSETAQAIFFLHEGLPGPLWIDPLKAGEKREVVIEGLFPRRGVVQRADAGLLSRFPLGLFRKYRRAGLAREIVGDPLPRSRPRKWRADERTPAGAAAAPTSARCGTSFRAMTRATCTGSSRPGCAAGSCASAKPNVTAWSCWQSRTRCPIRAIRRRSASSSGASRAARRRLWCSSLVGARWASRR